MLTYLIIRSCWFLERRTQSHTMVLKKGNEDQSKEILWKTEAILNLGIERAEGICKAIVVLNRENIADIQ